MKKRTILSLALAAMVFTAIVFHLQKEVIAQPQVAPIKVTVNTADGKFHAGIEVYLVNLTTSETTLIPMSTAPGYDPGSYPMVHIPGTGTGGFRYNTTDNFLVHVCGAGWGVNSIVFHLPKDITVTAGNQGCQAYQQDN